MASMILLEVPTQGKIVIESTLINASRYFLLEEEGNELAS